MTPPRCECQMPIPLRVPGLPGWTCSQCHRPIRPRATDAVRVAADEMALQLRMMTAVVADTENPDEDCGLTNGQLRAWQERARAALLGFERALA